MNGSSETLTYLRQPLAHFIDITVDIKDNGEGGIQIKNQQSDHLGHCLNTFEVTWPHPQGLNTEYGWGISLMHDLKDHRFYGLGITELTELQTIVQTYYGRAVAHTHDGNPLNEEWEEMILSAIDDELFGPRGPRVYGFDQRGLLDLHTPHADEHERNEARSHMIDVCFHIMLPPIQYLYRSNPAVRKLQAPTRAQAELVHAYLSGVVWSDPENLLLDIRDNVGLHVESRAYINDELHAMSEAIALQIADYTRKYRLKERFGRIFDTSGYTVKV